MIDEAEGFLLAALDLEGEDARTAAWEIAFIQRVIRMLRQRRMIDLRDLWMLSEEFDHLFGVLRVTFQTQGERFGSLQQEKCREWGNARALISEQNRADIGDEGCRTRDLRERYPMIARIRISNRRELTARLPVELAGIDDNTTERRAMAADELRRGVYHDVSAVFDRTDQIRSAEGIVYDNRKPLPVRERRDRVDVRNIAVRIAEGFQVNGLGIRADCRFDFLQIMRVNKGCFDPKRFECVREQVLSPAIYGLLANDVVPLLRERLDGIGDGRRAGRDG